MTGPVGDSRDLARELAKCWFAFAVPLRSGLGFDEDKLQLLREALENCAEAWSQVNFIPKLAANIFIDLFSTMDSSAYLYDEQTAEKIRYASDVVTDLARSCALVEDLDLDG